MKKLLLFSRDPGGANLIVSMYPILSQEYDIDLYGKDTALHVYEKNNLACKNMNQLLPSINSKTITEFLIHHKYDGILTSTSAEDFTERLLWQTAQKLNIFNAAILDQWMNYSLRFLKSPESYQTKKKYNLSEYILPQKIFVMDEYAKKLMVKEGIPDQLIRVTGQPYFESFIKKSIKTVTASKDNEKITWLFASEPITTVYGKEKGLNIYGYTEQSILYATCKAINKLQCKRIQLQIKPHPRDDIKVYTDICNQFPFVSLITINSVDAILQSDAVLGMSSTLLLEAALLDKPILSIQLNLKINSPFILDQINKSKSIIKEEKLEKELCLLAEQNHSATDSKFMVSLTTQKSAIKNIFLDIKKRLNF